MKVFYTCIILTISYLNSFAQIQIENTPKRITVGKITNVGQFYCELYYYVSEEKDSIYTLMYKNLEYSSILDLQQISFSNEGNAVDGFYKILKSVFSEENKKNKEYKIQFKLGENQIIVSNFRMMGVTVAFISPPIGYFKLSEKQVDKLFGKNK